MVSHDGGHVFATHAHRALRFVIAASLAFPACARTVRSREADTIARIDRIEQGLLPAIRVKGRTYAPATIEQRMRDHDTPAVSVAVINGGRIEWARAYGAADIEMRRPATPATLFQAASMSKPVASMGALRLVQEGRLVLDEDVNAKLRSWRVPATALTAKRPVTLRGILTHSAGLTVHGFPGYASDVPVPTVALILDAEKPANTAAVRVDVEPGSQWRYSGGGITVMQLLMTDVTAEAFPSLMRRLVLDPLQMTASTFEQPLSAARVADAATGYRSGSRPVAGRFHTYPEMAAAGLWTTPTDLARWIIEVQQSWSGQSNRVLSREMTAAMLTRGIGGWGLGLAIAGAGDSLQFSHGGANEGFRGAFIGFALRRQGAVVLTNSDMGGALADEILQAIGREYGWPGYPRAELVPIAMAPDAIRQYAGVYALPGGQLRLTVAVEADRLIVRVGGDAPVEIVPTGTDTFTPTAPAPPVRFERDSAGRVVALLAAGMRFERVP